MRAFLRFPATRDVARAAFWTVFIPAIGATVAYARDLFTNDRLLPVALTESAWSLVSALLAIPLIPVAFWMGQWEKRISSVGLHVAFIRLLAGFFWGF